MLFRSLATYDDGGNYGGLFGLANYKNGVLTSLFQATFNAPGYAPAPTISLLFPGEGILVTDSLYFYNDNGQYNSYQVIYG